MFYFNLLKFTTNISLCASRVIGKESNLIECQRGTESFPSMFSHFMTQISRKCISTRWKRENFLEFSNSHSTCAQQSKQKKNRKKWEKRTSSTRKRGWWTMMIWMILCALLMREFPFIQRLVNLSNEEENIEWLSDVLNQIKATAKILIIWIWIEMNKNFTE